VIRPYQFSEAEDERAGGDGPGNPSLGGAGSFPPAAPSSATLGLLERLLQWMREQQPDEGCYLCLSSDNLKSLCAEHRARVKAIREAA
jgi:hypothetical protein